MGTRGPEGEKGERGDTSPSGTIRNKGREESNLATLDTREAKER